MPTAGKARLYRGGPRGLRTTGKAQLFATSGRCSECCTPYVLASFTTNSRNPTWILTPYQGPMKATSCSFWRLIETGTCYPEAPPWYGRGCVDSAGRLVGLPFSFTSRFDYDGYMQLQIGCRSASGTHINWPGSCQSVSIVYAC